MGIMMTAAILGAGPEIDRFFDFDPSNRKDILPFSTTASDGHPQRHDSGIRVLNILDPREGVAFLHAAGVSRIVTIGSIKIKGNAYARNLSVIRELPGLAAARFQGKDALRRYYFQKLSGEFEFPPVRSVLPFLFASAEVCVDPGPNSDAAEAILNAVRSMDVPAATDAELPVLGCVVKIFRVPKDNARNLINRRLYLDKVKEAHGRGVKHFYFDIDRTIVVGLSDIISYAKEHAITLRSFKEA
jgi:hypothetical protein